MDSSRVAVHEPKTTPPLPPLNERGEDAQAPTSTRSPPSLRGGEGGCRERFRCLATLAGLCAACCLASAAADADPVRPETVAGLQSSLDAMVSARDRLLKSLAQTYAEAEAREPGRRIELDLTNGLLRQPLKVELRRWGGAWLPGVATAPKYNKSRNPVDSSGLAFAAGALKGKMKVTFISDGWVPKPGTSYELVYEINAAVAGSKVSGTYRCAGNPDLKGSVPSNYAKYERVHQTRVKYGSVRDLERMLAWAPFSEQERWDDLSGSTEELKFALALPGPEAPQKLEGLDAVGLYAAAVNIESRADAVYRQIRAAYLARLSALFFETALDIAPSLAPVRPAFDRATAAETVAAMEERIGRLRSLVAAAESWTPGSPVARIGEVDAGDPRFRGYFGQQPLAAEEGKANLVPAAVSDGPETWHYVRQWKVLGPYPGDSYRALMLPLPEMIPAPEAPCKRSPPGDADVPWRELSKQPYPFVDIGSLLEPRNGALAYATTELFSETDQDVWSALRPDNNDLCQLWVNDRPVWANVYAQPEASVFRVHLSKGRNRLLVRCENGWGDWGFALLLCLRGGPRTPAQIAAQQKEGAAADDPPPTRGWFGPGHRGVYPDATPVTAWDLQQGINVLWRLPFNRKSISTPLVLGDKVFTQAEPHTLVCVDKFRGRILWTRDSNIVEFLEDPQVRQQALADCEREAKSESPAELRKKEEEIQARSTEVENLLRANFEDEKAKALGEKLQEEINELELQKRGLRYWAAKLGTRADPTGHTGWFSSYVGYSAGSPVTDGQHVWVKYGTGVAACYDLDGNRKWMIRTHFNDDAATSMPSPMLVGDLLIIAGGNGWWRRNSKSPKLPATGKNFGHWMIGVEAASGKIRWDAGPLRSGGYGGPETPYPVKLTSGKEELWVIATGQGQIIRAQDGKLLLDDLGANCCFFASPVARGNVVYFTRGGHTLAVELAMQDRDTVGARILWKSGGGGVPGTVWYEGLLHCSSGTRDRGAAGALAYLAKDAATGADVARIDPVLPGSSGDDYVPTCAAGKYVFVFGGNAGAVVECGRNPRVLAKMKNERMYAQPVFDGDRMYLRTYTSLICIGPKGKEGRDYEKQVQARTLMEMFPVKLSPRASLPVESRCDLAPGPDLPQEQIVTGRVPRSWICAGPLAAREGQDALAELGGCEKALPRAGTQFGAKDAASTFARIDPQSVSDQGVQVDASGDGPKDTERFYFTVLDNRLGSRTFRVALAGPSAQAWLGGVPVKHLDIVAVRGWGLIPLLARVSFPARAPSFLKRGTLSVYLEETEDPDVEFRRQLAVVRDHADALKRVVEFVPGTGEAEKAQYLLSLLSADAGRPKPDGAQKPQP